MNVNTSAAFGDFRQNIIDVNACWRLQNMWMGPAEFARYRDNNPWVLGSPPVHPKSHRVVVIVIVLVRVSLTDHLTYKEVKILSCQNILVTKTLWPLIWTAKV